MGGRKRPGAERISDGRFEVTWLGQGHVPPMYGNVFFWKNDEPNFGVQYLLKRV